MENYLSGLFICIYMILCIVLICLFVYIVCKANDKEKEYILKLDDKQKALILDYKMNGRLSIKDFKRKKKEVKENEDK